MFVIGKSISFKSLIHFPLIISLRNLREKFTN